VRIGLATFSVVLVALSTGCSSGSSPGNGNSGASSGSGSGSGAGSSGSGSSGGGSGSSSSGGGSSGAGSSGSGGTSGGGTSSGASSGASGGADAAASGDGGSSSGADGAAALGPYPSGPYCAPAGSGGHLATGCVLPNTTWIGYDDEAADVVATMKPYASYSLDQARKSGKRYAMINVAEFSCPGCRNSATELQAGAAAVVQAGGVVIEVLETSGFITQATMADLMSWVSTYSLKNTTVKDPDGSGTPSLNYFGRRDTAYIVDLTTMTVIQWIDGSIAAQTTNSAGLAMTQMHTLLGR
jgi:hypothetical protein